MPRPKVPMLPIQPLLDELGELDNRLYAAVIGCSLREIVRARRQGITVRSADRYACHAGLHPLVVWGEAWTEAETERQRLEDEADRARREYRLAYKRARRVENRAWRQIESRWAQWAAQQDRNTFEAAQRHTG